MGQYKNGLFIFRRDLRIFDNTGLNILNNICKNIYTVFIFTPEQISQKNKFKSDNAVQFMIESLEDLSIQIRQNKGRLYCFHGDNMDVISYLIESLNIDCVAFNSDCTPYAIKRDCQIDKLCKDLGVYVEHGDDYYLHKLGSIKTLDDKSYQMFTPFYRNASKRKVKIPFTPKDFNFIRISKKLEYSVDLKMAMENFTVKNDEILVHGGRINAIAKIKNSSKIFKSYVETRDNLSKYTTETSAYIKFGCISIREAYKMMKNSELLIRQLYWRDFYANIMYEFPHVIKSAMKPSYDNIEWLSNTSQFKKWCNGQTGFPVVDAGMRQLVTTGYMHNRARLIVASFLVKTLMISWKRGEKFFASKLIDYDPASNNGNWQWVAGSGTDAQPYFRIFNPWTQQKNHDPNCEYIKKWIPELADLPSKTIHNWNTTWEENRNIDYPKPIVDYTVQRKLALDMYAKGLGK